MYNTKKQDLNIYLKIRLHESWKLWCFKRHSEETEKTNHIFGEKTANNLSDKRLVSRVYKEHLRLN